MSNNKSDGASLNNNNCDNDEKCTSCNSINCNGHSLRSKFSLKKCLNCDSKNDPKCVNDLSPKLSKECKKDDDQCFIHIEKFNIKRGCLSDQSADFEDICKKDAKKCSLCNENDCNSNPIVLETCIDCNSANDDKCQPNLNPYKGKICSTLKSNNSLGCYVSMVKCFENPSKSKLHSITQNTICKSFFRLFKGQISSQISYNYKELNDEINSNL